MVLVGVICVKKEEKVKVLIYLLLDNNAVDSKHTQRLQTIPQLRSDENKVNLEVDVTSGTINQTYTYRYS